MTRQFQLLTAALALTTIGCMARPVPTAIVAPIFGPAVSDETISGRITDRRGGVVLLVGGAALVRIDIDARSQSRVAVRSTGRERCWGLAQLVDGSLWTLLGRRAAIQVGLDGQIIRQIALATAHFGLFGVGDELIFQQASLPAGTPALYAAHPGESTRRVWSALVARPFEALAAGAATALNLVSCGGSQRVEIPCWFPDEPAVALIAPDGATRRIELPGLPHVAPEALINASAPQRPVRDVFVEKDGTLWVISTGTVPQQAKNAPGGWLLARYGPRGEPIDRRLLPEPARVILRAGGGRALVLTGSGMVAEVVP